MAKDAPEEKKPFDEKKPLLPAAGLKLSATGTTSLKLSAPGTTSLKLSAPGAGATLLRRRGVSLPAELVIAPASIAAVAGIPGSQGGEYTSLRDIIGWPPPAGMASPTTPGAAGCGGGNGEIRIRNRLVQQAAHAYLQPTPSAVGRRRRGLMVSSCGEFLTPCLQFLGRLFQYFCGCLCRLG